MPRKPYRPDVELLEARYLLSTVFVVTTSADTNFNPAASPRLPVSLRDAISASNNLGGSGGSDVEIDFAIPGNGVQSIHVGNTGLGDLPTITNPVFINGQSQPGFKPSHPLIELSGAEGGAFNGLVIDAGNTTVRGLIIDRFNGDGILIQNQGGNLIQGDFVGTQPDGGAGAGNQGHGVEIQAPSSGNTIGGSSAVVNGRLTGQGNLISSNLHDGIFISANSQTGESTNGNVIQGNFLGTDVTGTRRLVSNNSLGGVTNGIEIRGFGGSDTIGGAVTFDSAGNLSGFGNVISGNQGFGVRLEQSDFNLLQGNLIGTDVTGSTAVGNGGVGVEISISSDNTVGGTSASERNVISGNGSDGIDILFSSFFNQVLGNYIGTCSDADRPIGNAGDGVHIEADASHNTLGGTDSSAGNVIAANGLNGVSIQGFVFSGGGRFASIRSRPNATSGNFFFNNAARNVLESNFIGTNSTGTLDLGNGRNGVFVDTAAQNFIGGFTGGEGQSTPGPGNVIAFNRQDGVQILERIQPSAVPIGTNSGQSFATGDTISQNAIYANGLLGIDLGGDGVTPNRPDSPHIGANDGQNFPVIVTATSAGGQVALQGVLNSTPDGTFRLEFFGNAVADPTGFGQGQVYLGALTVNTDSAGNAAFAINFPASSVGAFVSSTATDVNRGDTSEFSATVPSGVPTPPPPPPPQPTPSTTFPEIQLLAQVQADPLPPSPRSLPVVPPMESLPTNIPPAPQLAPQQSGSVAIGEISGAIFEDYNGNGIRDPGEPPAAGLTVFLDLNHNGVYDPGEPTTTTDEKGQYIFPGLRIDDYSVRVLLDSRTEQTSPRSPSQEIKLTPQKHTVTRVNFSTRRVRRVRTPVPSSQLPHRDPEAPTRVAVQAPRPPAPSPAEERAAVLDQALRAAVKVPDLAELAAAILGPNVGLGRPATVAMTE